MSQGEGLYSLPEQFPRGYDMLPLQEIADHAARINSPKTLHHILVMAERLYIRDSVTPSIRNDAMRAHIATIKARHDQLLIDEEFAYVVRNYELPINAMTQLVAMQREKAALQALSQKDDL